MTTIAIVTLTRLGATLLAAIIITATMVATASVAATSPDSTDSRRCFRAITAAGAGEAILAAVGPSPAVSFGAICGLNPILGPIADPPQTAGSLRASDAKPKGKMPEGKTAPSLIVAREITAGGAGR
jgi:hypothetical protein